MNMVRLDIIEGPTPAEGRTKFVVGLWLRVGSGVVFLALLLPFSMSGIDFDYGRCAAAYIGLIILVAINGVYWFAGRAREFPLGDFYWHWGIDLIVITAILYGLGGARLPSAITPYILIVITSAVFISRKAAVLVATGGTVAFTGLIGAESIGIADPPYELDFGNLSLGLRVFQIASPVFMLYLVALIAGTLGNDLNTANRQLKVRNEELAERNEQLDRVTGELEFQSKVLTHDIRSPVTAAVGALGFAKRSLGEDLSRSQEMMELALANLYRVEDMVAGLDVARELGGFVSEREWVDVAAIAQELKGEIAFALSRKGIQLILDEGPRNVWAERHRMVVIVRNLLTNAIRYVPGDGNGLIECGICETSLEWRVFVKDNGCGIPSGFEDQIFEMFRKAPSSEGSGGMGVGLALVRRAAEQQGGRAWAETSGGAGATFWVSIPKGLRSIGS